MNCLYLVLVFLVCTSDIRSQGNAHVLMVKKNSKTVQKFFPEQPILIETSSGYALGKIEAISPQFLTIQMMTIQKKKSALGLMVRDTSLLGSANIIALDAITGIYLSKGNHNDGVYFTEASQNKTSVKSITAPKGEAFYDTYWNTGEAGYLVTAVLNTLIDKTGKKKIKDMRKIGKKYRLVVI